MAEKNVVIVGVHTPETEAERSAERVKKKVKDNLMKYPIAIDNKLETWKAWDNRYWPCVYLIDKLGFVRYRWDGELNWQGAQGEVIMKKKIEELLAER